MGALTPLGNDVTEFWSALTQGKSGIGPITKFDAQTKTASGEFQFVTRIAGEVRNFDELKYVDKKDARRLDPRSEEHTSELQSRQYLVCRLLLEKKKKKQKKIKKQR